MERVLVTGATGFIGKRLLEYLLNKNLSVRILLRDPKKDTPFPANVSIFTGDLTEANSLKNICDQIDTVFHLAGYAHAWAENNADFTQQHHLINYQGTQNILNEALAAKVKKFIFFSSVKAVADSEDYIDETWEKEPDSAYGIAKRKAEQVVLNAKTQGMHVCILRPALVYGPGWKGNLASMLRAIDKGLFPALPETYNRRSLISVNDLCEAAFLAANNPQANGKIYFVTDGKFYSTHNLYKAMRQALGKQLPTWYIPLWVFKLLAKIGDLGKKLTGRRLPFNSEAMTKLFGSAQYNSQLIQKELCFKATYDLEKMLPDIINIYRNYRQTK